MTSYELELELNALRIKEENQRTLERYEKDKLLVGNCYSSVKLNKRTTFGSQESFYIYMSRLDDVELRTDEEIHKIMYIQTDISITHRKPDSFSIDVCKYSPKSSMHGHTYPMSPDVFQTLFDMGFEANDFLFNSFYTYLKTSPIKSVVEHRRDDDTSKLFERIGTEFLPLTNDETRWLTYRGHPFVYDSGIYVNEDSIKLLDIILLDEQEKLREYRRIGHVKDTRHAIQTIETFTNIKNKMLEK